MVHQPDELRAIRIAMALVILTVFTACGMVIFGVGLWIGAMLRMLTGAP